MTLTEWYFRTKDSKPEMAKHEDDVLVILEKLENMNSGLNVFEDCIELIRRAALYHKKGYISKSEYNRKRKIIELVMFS